MGLLGWNGRVEGMTNVHLICSQCSGSGNSASVMAFCVEMSHKSFGLFAKDLVQIDATMFT